jgi:NAD-dependent SIR2 family protein deacetylase
MSLTIPDRVVEALAAARALFVAAGAGMGVDSGLPDFRGTEGFWNAYPPYRALGIDFTSMANPRWFKDDPALAWGFYGHRLALYRATRPHRGFALLRRWAAATEHGGFAFTSNVDGQFQRAGFGPEQVVEAHGAIEWLQCLAECGEEIFPAPPEEVTVDPGTMRASGPLPCCPRCGALARPNILMFGDWGWDEARSIAQERRLRRWLERAASSRMVIVECGAGTAVPTVRHTCESLAADSGALLVRLNPREPQVPRGEVGIAAGALAALEAIEARLARPRS